MFANEKTNFYNFPSPRSTTSLRRSGEITLVIYLKLTLEMLAALIENYEFLISKVRYEIEMAKAKGIDVRLAEDYLRRAGESLQLAKSFFW